MGGWGVCGRKFALVTHFLLSGMRTMPRNIWDGLPEQLLASITGTSGTPAEPAAALATMQLLLRKSPVPPAARVGSWCRLLQQAEQKNKAAVAAR